MSRRFSGPPWSDSAILGGKKLADVFKRKTRGRLSEAEARLFWRIFIAGVWLQAFDLSVPSRSELQDDVVREGRWVKLENA